MPRSSHQVTLFQPLNGTDCGDMRNSKMPRNLGHSGLALLLNQFRNELGIVFCDLILMVAAGMRESVRCHGAISGLDRCHPVTISRQLARCQLFAFGRLTKNVACATFKSRRYNVEYARE